MNLLINTVLLFFVETFLGMNGLQTNDSSPMTPSRSPSPPSSSSLSLPSSRMMNGKSSPSLASSVARIVEGNHYNLLLVAATAAALHQKEVDESKASVNRSPTSGVANNKISSKNSSPEHQQSS